MNISYVYNAVRRYGIKGIVNFIASRHKDYAFKRYLKGTVRSVEPERGITLISCFDYPGSLSKVMRDFALLLKQAQIPYQTLNIPCKNPIPYEEIESFITPKEEFCINKYTHIITMRDFLAVPDARCRVHGIEFWEFESGFLSGCPEVHRAESVLAMSDFNLEVFRKSLPKNVCVSKVLYPFQFVHGELAPRGLTREKYNIGKDDFVVFFNFDYASSYYRKNPEGLLRAFAKALGGEANAKIVLKTMRAKKRKEMSERLRSLSQELGLSTQLITVDDFILQEDLVNLTGACDVYASLHRGEGFGLGIAEAMSLGKAVVVTDYSSTTEFCNKNNALLVPYEIVDVKDWQVDVDAYKSVEQWAEPDIDAAAAALRKLYDDKELREKIGLQAQKFIKDYFSVENFRESIEKFLDERR